MTIPHYMLRRWEALRERGDVNKIAKRGAVTRATISNALNTGKCTFKTFTAISEYFNDIEKKIDSLNPVEND